MRASTLTHLTGRQGTEVVEIDLLNFGNLFHAHGDSKQHPVAPFLAGDFDGRDGNGIHFSTTGTLLFSLFPSRILDAVLSRNRIRYGNGDRRRGRGYEKHHRPAGPGNGGMPAPPESLRPGPCYLPRVFSNTQLSSPGMSVPSAMAVCPIPGESIRRWRQEPQKIREAKRSSHAFR